MKNKFKIIFLPILFFFILGSLYFWKINFSKKILPGEGTAIQETNTKTAVSAEMFKWEKIFVQNFPLPEFEIEKPIFPENHCDILSYGALPGGVKKNTESFKKAIEDCAKKGGGRVFVPKGIWLTGPIQLESNINLYFEEGAEIIFTQDFEDYLPVVFTRFEGVEIYNFSPPIYARGKTNIAITGKGKINGRSKDFWWKSNKSYETLLSLEKIYQMANKNEAPEERVFGEKEAGIRPSFIQFIDCNRILIEDVEIIDGPMWSIHPVYSQNIFIRGVSVNTRKGSNTDGVVIDSSKNALIEESYFSTGDDAIAIKSGRDADGRRVGRPSENIAAKNIRVEDSHAGLAVGSEVSGGIKNVFASDFSIKKSDYGLRLKSGPTRGGKVENIFFKGFELELSEIAGFEIDLNYGRNGETEPLPNDLPTDFENVSVENFYSQKSRHPFFIKGHSEEKIEEISFKNIEIRSANDARIYDAKNIIFENLKLIPAKEKTPKIKTRNSQNISIQKSAFSPGQIDCEKEPCEFSFD